MRDTIGVMLCRHTRLGWCWAIIHCWDDAVTSYTAGMMLCRHTRLGWCCAVIHGWDDAVPSYTTGIVLCRHTRLGWCCGVIHCWGDAVPSFSPWGCADVFVLLHTAHCSQKTGLGSWHRCKWSEVSLQAPSINFPSLISINVPFSLCLQAHRLRPRHRHRLWHRHRHRHRWRVQCSSSVSTWLLSPRDTQATSSPSQHPRKPATSLTSYAHRATVSDVTPEGRETVWRHRLRVGRRCDVTTEGRETVWRHRLRVGRRCDVIGWGSGDGVTSSAEDRETVWRHYWGSGDGVTSSAEGRETVRCHYWGSEDGVTSLLSIGHGSLPPCPNSHIVSTTLHRAIDVRYRP